MRGLGKGEARGRGGSSGRGLTVLQDFHTQGVGDRRRVLGRGVPALPSTHSTRSWRWGAERGGSLGLGWVRSFPNSARNHGNLGERS